MVYENTKELLRSIFLIILGVPTVTGIFLLICKEVFCNNENPFNFIGCSYCFWISFLIAVGIVALIIKAINEWRR